MKRIVLMSLMLLVLVIGGRQLFGPGAGAVSTANLAQGLFLSTEAKLLVNEHWAINGALPCDADDLEFGIAPGRGRAVLAAIGVSDCGQITLVYNDASGMPGRRMVLEAEETTGERGVELAWRCWTPDFPDIERSLAQCRYEDRELAALAVEADLRDTVADADAANSPAASVAQVDTASAAETACGVRAAIFRPVFTDRMDGRVPENRVTSYGPGREQLVFYTEVIGAAGRQIKHKWFFDGIEIDDHAFAVESDRWPTWSSQRMEGVAIGTLRVDVYDDHCLIGQATIQSGGEAVAEAPAAGGWMRPQQALATTLSKPQIDYATNAERNHFVDDLTDNGDTLLLAAIRRADTDEALILINRVKPPEPPFDMRLEEVRAMRGRHYRKADPFLKDADGISPIQLAHELGQDEIVAALIESTLSFYPSRNKTPRPVAFTDAVIDTLLSNNNGFKRFDDGDTPLLRAVRTNNERAVLTMLSLPGWHDNTDPYRPRVDLYAYDATGRQALTIAQENGFYAIERLLTLAMTRSSPGWAVTRATFTTTVAGGQPGNCRKTAFADEGPLHFYTELTDMSGQRVAHEWRFKRELVQRIEFDVDDRRWSTYSSRDFSPADIGGWEVRVVTGSGEVLRTAQLNYQALSDYNRRNREKFHAPCSLGGAALSALVKAQAPIAELEYLLGTGTVLKMDSSLAKALVVQAIVDGNIPLAGWFVDRGFDINAYVDGAATPLMVAVDNDNGAMALFLMTRGADVGFKRYRDGASALQLSVAGRQTALAMLLLEHGADPNTQNDRGYTPLHSAVMRCDGRTTRALLEHGADPGLENDQGETARDHVVECAGREAWGAGVVGLDAG